MAKSLPRKAKSSTPQITASAPRRGARRMSEIPPSVLESINAGKEPTISLVEFLAADFSALLAAVEPTIKPDERVQSGVGVVKRMAGAGELLAEFGGRNIIDKLRSHQSDIVRGWGCYVVANTVASLAGALKAIKPFADDPHSGVREWAWLAVRGHIANNPLEAVSLLTPWANSPQVNIRRFASEATRPRGVWCVHIPLLRQEPQHAIAILDPLASDEHKYVQDSCANWLNDASKSRPDWVREVCGRWQRKHKDNPATARIVRRALRTIGVEHE